MAAISSLIGAWLFLPIAGYELPGLPDYTKMFAASVGVLIGTLVFDVGRFRKLRFTIWDIPMFVWCICPFFSSITNGLGSYDGFSGVVTKIVTWAIPYYLGRLYFSDVSSIRDLAIAIFIGGVIYVPFCLVEIRISPQLHTWIYGFHQHTFGQSYRYGGWRPTVFMQHGLMVGMWMCMASVVGIALWLSSSLTRLFNRPMVWTLTALVVTAVMCKSGGAIMLLTTGAIVLVSLRYCPSRLVLIALVIAAPLYMSSRISGWSGAGLLQVIEQIEPERAESMEFRMFNEDLLVKKALKQPVFGWGGWSRNRVFNDKGEDISVTDGLWVIILGVNGFVGLCSFVALLSTPLILTISRIRRDSFLGIMQAPATALAVVVALYLIDCIPNGMINPIFVVCAGSGYFAKPYEKDSLF